MKVRPTTWVQRVQIELLTKACVPTFVCAECSNEINPETATRRSAASKAYMAGWRVMQGNVVCPDCLDRLTHTQRGQEHGAGNKDQ